MHPPIFVRRGSASSLLFALSVTLTACGDDAPAPTSPLPPDPAPTATTPPPGPSLPAARSLVTARAMATRPENLVLDPTFGAANGMYAATLYASEATMTVRTPPTSPAGPSQSVLDVAPSAARAALVVVAQGGFGPFDASVFVATDDGSTPSVYVASPDGRDAYELAPAAGKDQTHGGRTYRLYAARITEPLYGKFYLVVESGSAFSIAAPDVMAGGAASPRPAAARAELRGAAARAVHAFASRPVVPDPHRGARMFRPDPGRIAPPGL